MSIIDEIKEFERHKMFCTPGHKGTLDRWDITEIEGSFPLDFVQKAEEKVAEYINVPHLRFLTGGSSLGVKASLLGAKEILVQTGAHKSVTDSALLSGAKVRFIESEIQRGITLPPTKKQVVDALKAYPNADTVVLTTPDYYGLCVDETIAKIIKKEGKRLHIDGAHGAHALFRPDLFPSEIYKYADTFNLSAHKTLPAPTQTAYLAINNPALIKEIDRNLAILGTTSPSYPMLAALENAAEITMRDRGDYDQLLRAVKSLKKEIKCLKNDDFTRIVVDTDDFRGHKAGANGGAGQVFKVLKNRGIIAEKYDQRYIIFIVTICDSTEDIELLTAELVRLKLGVVHVEQGVSTQK